MSNELIERIKRLQQECQDALDELAALKHRERLKIDDKVMVRIDVGDEWKRRYFAGWDGEDIRCFDEGSTSWSSNGRTVSWNYWRLPTEEELR